MPFYLLPIFFAAVSSRFRSYAHWKISELPFYKHILRPEESLANVPVISAVGVGDMHFVAHFLTIKQAIL